MSHPHPKPNCIFCHTEEPISFKHEKGEAFWFILGEDFEPVHPVLKKDGAPDYVFEVESIKNFAWDGKEKVCCVKCFTSFLQRGPDETILPE